MRICGIIGSPKKNGNVDLLVTQVLKGAQSQGAEVQKFYLNDMCIRPCQSCGTILTLAIVCMTTTWRSSTLGWNPVTSSLGSPVYFDTVSAQTKLVIDRCTCLVPYVRRPDGTYEFERRLKKNEKKRNSNCCCRHRSGI